QFIVDASTATMLRTTIVPTSVPQEVWERIRVFVTSSDKRAGRRAPVSGDREREGPPRVPAERLAEEAGRSVMLFKPTLMQDLEQSACLADSRLVFSMWSGYLEYENANPVLEWHDRNQIPLDQFHTSGHAALIELVELRRAFSSAPVVPIGRHPERF